MRRGERMKTGGGGLYVGGFGWGYGGRCLDFWIDVNLFFLLYESSFFVLFS